MDIGLKAISLTDTKLAAAPAARADLKVFKTSAAWASGAK
jgi:hypothetical protein